MIIDGVFKNLPEQITEYQDLLKKLIFLDHNEGLIFNWLWESKIFSCNYIFFLDPVIPMYYYVPQEQIEKEKQEPGSADKKMVVDQGLYLWNQAMFVLAQLLTAGLLHINELDPIRRYLPSYNRPRKGGRYSAFQVSMMYLF